MKAGKNLTIYVIALVGVAVMLSGCIQEDTQEEKTRTIQKQKTQTLSKTTTHAKPTATTLSHTLKATTVAAQTTTVTKQTTAKADECAKISGSLNQSACYFNKAIAENDKSICEKISHGLTQDMCLNRVGVEAEATSKIFGWVKRRTPAEGLGGLTVSVKSTTRDAQYLGTTSASGKYLITVHGGDRYAVTVHYAGKEFTQHVNAKRNWEHEVDYIIED